MHDYETLKRIILAQGSRIFSVTFIKRDGTPRRMLCQLEAARTHSRGADGNASHRVGAETSRERNPWLVIAYDMGERGTRSFDIRTVSRLACGGRTYSTTTA